MKLLAFDTSSLACTVGAGNGDSIVVRHEEQAREHTRLLLPMIRDALDESGIALPDLDAIVVGNGPGSFIGMRIAASVAQGLAHSIDVPIVPVSSMAAVADAAGSDGDVVAVSQDAHMREVYLGLYRLAAGAVPEEIAPERLHNQQRIDELAGLAGSKRIAAGFGWQQYPDLLATNREMIDEISDIWYPRADSLLRLGRMHYAAGRTVDADALNPAYLRQKVAQKSAARDS